MTAGLVLLPAVPGAADGLSWPEVQEAKREGLASAARRAIEQQRLTHHPSKALEAAWSGVGQVDVSRSDAWDVDGDGESYRIEVRDVPVNLSHVNVRDRIAVRFPEPVNLLETSTGFAFWVKTPEDLSPDLRVGVLFKVEGSTEDPVIFADTPLVQRFGDNPHQIYFDWGHVFAHSMRVFATPPRDFFTRVTGFDLVLVHKRLPSDKEKLEPASGHFFVDGLELVDAYDGTYDNSRFRDGGINTQDRIVAQARFQQVSLIAAQFGGEEGIQSAIRAMDHLARIQSWDGSWPDLYTRLQGEYIPGMIVADTARALQFLREQDHPALKETVTIRHWTLPRDQLYEQMMYRVAMSRTPGPFSVYYDTYVDGPNMLRVGANRPMAYALGQYLAATVQTDPERRQAIMREYDLNMDDLVAAQGITAGGWPIFGESNRGGDDSGLRWDAGYTSDHVSIIANALRSTDDPRWAEIMRKLDTVIEVMMLPDGLHMDGGLSERGGNTPKDLKAADIVYQEALKAGAPNIAQWGANLSQHVWSNWPRSVGTLWPNTRTFRGYPLGAFLTWQVYDLDPEPQPKDTGVVFPRQWPVWTAAWKNKAGETTRQSKLLVRPDGSMVNTFEWKTGEYPEITAAPVQLAVSGGEAVEIEPLIYEGNVRKLPADAGLTLAFGPAEGDLGPARPMVEDAAEPAIQGPTVVEIKAPGHELLVRFRVTPRGEEALTLAVNALRAPRPYEHLFAPETAADVKLDQGGINLADPVTGTRLTPLKCQPSREYGIDRATDGKADTAWVIGTFAPGGGLRFDFPREVKLDRLVLAQGDWQQTFDLARTVTVTLSDGTEKEMTFERAPGKDVELKLEGVKTESLTLTLKETWEAPKRQQSIPVGGWSNLRILTAAP